jgi:hypothetical protein
LTIEPGGRQAGIAGDVVMEVRTSFAALFLATFHPTDHERLN